jgi:hypothetical protein
MDQGRDEGGADHADLETRSAAGLDWTEIEWVQGEKDSRCVLLHCIRVTYGPSQLGSMGCTGTLMMMSRKRKTRRCHRGKQSIPSARIRDLYRDATRGQA